MGIWHPERMAHFIVGRLFGWPEFAEDGDDVWLIHIDEPTFFLRVIHRPEDLVPTGNLNDLYFPLVDDSRYAVGNLIFIEPRPADPRDVAQLVAVAIDAIQHEDVARLLAFANRPFNPSSAELQPMMCRPSSDTLACFSLPSTLFHAPLTPARWYTSSIALTPQ